MNFFVSLSVFFSHYSECPTDMVLVPGTLLNEWYCWVGGLFWDGWQQCIGLMQQKSFGAQDVTTPVTERPALVWDGCIARCQDVDTCVIPASKDCLEHFGEKQAQNTKLKPVINFIL